MISILAQERLLGAALGTAFASAVIFEHRRRLYESISKLHPKPKEPIFGQKSRQEFCHLWNKSVDKAFAPLIQSLSSRGW